MYDRKLLSLDEALTGFLEGLRTRVDYDRTVVVITSDHGESFGDHGFWGHGKLLHESLIRVPLYIKSVGQRRGEENHQSMTGDAVFSLMLREIGLKSYPRGGPDRPVAEVYPDAEMSSAGASGPTLAWLDGGIKTVIDGFGNLRMFDLNDDPLEQVDMEWPEDAEELWRRRDRWLAEHAPEVPEPGSLPELTPEDIERLRALGYLNPR